MIKHEAGRVVIHEVVHSGKYRVTVTWLWQGHGEPQTPHPRLHVQSMSAAPAAWQPIQTFNRSGEPSTTDCALAVHPHAIDRVKAELPPGGVAVQRSWHDRSQRGRNNRSAPPKTNTPPSGSWSRPPPPSESGGLPPGHP
jgi:hypothetical protein